MRGPDWEPKFEDPEIQTYLAEVAGEDGLQLFKYILDNEPVSGEAIVEAYGASKPSEVRKLLYGLMQAHALEYHKDTDSKGWETFTWQTDLPEIKLIHMRRWAEELADLRKRHKFEEDHEFYDCSHGHHRMIFEDAMDVDFQCPVCGDAMQPVDNGTTKQEIEERIHALATALEG